MKRVGIIILAVLLFAAIGVGTAFAFAGSEPKVVPGVPNQNQELSQPEQQSSPDSSSMENESRNDDSVNDIEDSQEASHDSDEAQEHVNGVSPEHSVPEHSIPDSSAHEVGS